MRLDVALQLLQQSGVALPGTRESDPAGWLQAVLDGLCELSSRDALTGLANRRQFELAMAREIDRVARAGEPALVLMIDIDHFKKVNDTHGHPAGDQVLREVGRALHDCIRPMDTVARFGGEEFAMILPNCPPAFGQAVAERVRSRVASRPVSVAPGQEVAITVSIGGAFMSTTGQFAYGDSVIVHVHLPGLDAEIAIPCTVRWMMKDGCGVQFGVMGVRETHALVEIAKRG